MKNKPERRWKYLSDLGCTLDECGILPLSKIQVDFYRSPSVLESIRKPTWNPENAGKHSIRESGIFVAETLNEAIKHSSIEDIQKLLSGGCPADSATLSGALVRQDPLIIELILNMGAEVNQDTLNCAILWKEDYAPRMVELGASANEYSITCVELVGGSSNLHELVTIAAPYVATKKHRIPLPDYLENLQRNYMVASMWGIKCY